MPLLGSRGAASAQGFGRLASAGLFTYIEDVFSTNLYPSLDTATTVNNGINLSGKGGMVWTTARNKTGISRYINDTAASFSTYVLRTDTTDAQGNESASVTSFNSNGFTGFPFGTAYAAQMVSWTFRKQPKFFDIVTGTGSNSVPHSLGVVPGCIIMKVTSGPNGVSNWIVKHRSIDTGINSNSGMNLNTPSAVVNQFGNFAATSTDIGFNPFVSSTDTWVAYLFAHDAGGFGLTGTDNVISCGTYTGNGSASGPAVSLGYEPQWLMIKEATTISNTGNWNIIDNMRGMPVGSTDSILEANLNGLESSVDYVIPTATGFQIVSTNSQVNTNASTYIYIAIRRGPMRIPTSGTQVFSAATRTGTGANVTVSSAVSAMDMVLVKNRPGGSNWWNLTDKLRGVTKTMAPNSTSNELTFSDGLLTFGQNSYTIGITTDSNQSGVSHIDYVFKRAPGFMDVLCYTGTGVTRTVAHNLVAVPELMIVKRRSTSAGWVVYSSLSGPTLYQYLNTTAASATFSTTWNNTAPTATVFTVGTDAEVNGSAATFVAYLFASCPGVSKVGSYTGTSGIQQINCGFTNGARFVMIKRTDSTGNWYIWDTARGILNLENEVVYSTPGTYTWTVPVGVTSISVVCVGGGGGGGSSGGGVTATAGSTSYFNNTSVVAAGGGGAIPGSNNTVGVVGGTGGTVLAGTGTNGATGPARVSSFNAVGGGGAGLLSGSTGAAGGENGWGGGGGGGADLYSTGSTAGAASHSNSSRKGGLGGGYGGGGGGGRDGLGGGGGAIAYINNYAVTAGQTYTVVVGSGGTGQNAAVPNDRGGGQGGHGAVRIVWSGASRQFPSTSITAQGGLDPYLLINSTSAEVTNTTFINPNSTGFEINSTSSEINATGGSYIYLAIA